MPSSSSGAHRLSSIALFSYIVVGSERPADVEVPCRTQRELRREVLGDVIEDRKATPSEVAPMIGSWITACFPGSSPTSKASIEELIAEAAEAVRSDYGVEAANEWADGYVFPPEMLASNVHCLQSAQLDFR